MRTIRTTLGLKQKPFAEALEISVPTLSEIEHDKTPPGFNILRNAALKYNVNVHYVILGEGDPFRSNEKDKSDELAQLSENSQFSPKTLEFLKFMFDTDYNTLQVLLMYERLKLSDDPLLKDYFENQSKKQGN